MRPSRRFTAGGLLLALAWLWKLKGPRGSVVAHLGPLPGINAGDLVTLPLIAAGLACLASAPGLPRWRRVLGALGPLLGVLWVTSELPWSDPLIPGLQFRRHGVHLLDLLAAGPVLGGLALLTPGVSRWFRRRGTRAPRPFPAAVRPRRAT